MGYLEKHTVGAVARVWPSIMYACEIIMKSNAILKLGKTITIPLNTCLHSEALRRSERLQVRDCCGSHSESLSLPLPIILNNNNNTL